MSVELINNILFLVIIINSQKKVKARVSEKLGIDLDIERAHRVERRQTTLTQRSNEVRPQTIVCKLKCYKQREEVSREERKNKPQGLCISEDLSRATFLKREEQIDALTVAIRVGRRRILSLIDS